MARNANKVKLRTTGLGTSSWPLSLLTYVQFSFRHWAGLQAFVNVRLAALKALGWCTYNMFFLQPLK
jgi:hypothetical protein